MHRELGARLRWYIGLGEPPIDRRLRDLPYEIGDEEDDHAGESARSSRVRSVSRSVIPTRSICCPGEPQRRQHNQEGSETALQDDLEYAALARCLRLAGRAKQMGHGGLNDVDDCRQEKRDDDKPEHPTKAGDPEKPQQDTARRENDAERGPPAPPFVLGCCHGVEWPAPDHLEPDGQQAQPEEVGRRLA